ncbi:helix-turn-helix domain-containing protein [Adlercreutzia mucosicola]|uniref:helix-turn-helix domain-containing protein n=1 Tax=Adlercreutzia mucosicola TaxID=580026 RepID=UPI00214C98FF
MGEQEAKGRLTPSEARILDKMRKMRGICVAELARRIGVDKKRLWYVLNGQREMRVDEFLKLCVALRLDPRSFVTHEMMDCVAEATRRSIERYDDIGI